MECPVFVSVLRYGTHFLAYFCGPAERENKEQNEKKQIYVHEQITIPHARVFWSHNLFRRTLKRTTMEPFFARRLRVT